MSKIIKLTQAQIDELESVFAELREHKNTGAIVAQVFRDGMRVRVLSPEQVVAVARAIKHDFEPITVQSVYE